jgi:FkbM family methyltransferase
MIRRTFTLIRRSVAAAKLGFAFIGTTKTKFPKSVRLSSTRVELSVPPDRGYIFDLVNVWLDDEYGLLSIAGPPKTIMDVGANVGIFSLWAAHRFPKARIQAYEPNPRVIPYLQSNLRGLSVEIHGTGLGAKSGKACMMDSAESRLASTSTRADGEIEIEPLDKAIDRFGGSVDLMKMDCEGAEWDLFEDSDAIRKVKEIRMEYHLVHGRRLDHFRDKVHQLGFSILKLHPNEGFGIAWLRRNGA